MDYIVLNLQIDPPDPEAVEIASAFLAEAGFESFEEVNGGLNACIQASLFDEMQTGKVLSDLPFNQKLSWTFVKVPARNWNEEWEKSFEPVRVENRCMVRASFHPVDPDMQYCILIDPRMAFGTGHHETTWMMISAMLDLALEEKRVLDMGTGTGVLAILARMKGAREVTAVDIDEWACNSTRDNIAMNKAEPVKIIQGDIDCVIGLQADVILANINRNILMKHIPDYYHILAMGGTLVISGFLDTDEDVILKCASEYHLKLTRKLRRNNWIALILCK